MCQITSPPPPPGPSAMVTIMVLEVPVRQLHLLWPLDAVAASQAPEKRGGREART